MCVGSVKGFTGFGWSGEWVVVVVVVVEYVVEYEWCLMGGFIQIYLYIYFGMLDVYREAVQLMRDRAYCRCAMS